MFEHYTEIVFRFSAMRNVGSVTFWTASGVTPAPLRAAQPFRRDIDHRKFRDDHVHHFETRERQRALAQDFAARPS